MTDQGSNFLLVTVLMVAAFLIVFAMKYFVAAYRHRLDSNRQGATDLALDNLRREVDALALRVNAIDKLLREVE